MTKGKDFEARMRRRFEQAGCYVQKLTDAAAPFVGRPELGGAGLSRFAPRNPYDFFVLKEVERGMFRAFAFELKSTSQRRFTLDTVKDHQLAGLRKFPGTAGVLVEIRPAQRCFFVQLNTLETWTGRTGKKSMNLSDLEQHENELPRDTSGRERKDYYSVRLFTAPAIQQPRGGDTVSCDYDTLDEMNALLAGEVADETYTDVSAFGFDLIAEMGDFANSRHALAVVRFGAACYALGRMEER